MRAVLALLLANLAVALALGIGSAAAQTDQAEAVVVVGKIDGIINPVMAGYVNRVIGEGESSNAAAVVFYMDTPGGLSDAMRDINLRILASRVPVIVYVAPDGSPRTDNMLKTAGAVVGFVALVVALRKLTR